MNERQLRMAAEEWLIMTADEREEAMRDWGGRMRYAPLNDAIFNAPEGGNADDHKALIDAAYGVTA